MRFVLPRIDVAMTAADPLLPVILLDAEIRDPNPAVSVLKAKIVDEPLIADATFA